MYELYELPVPRPRSDALGASPQLLHLGLGRLASTGTGALRPTQPAVGSGGAHFAEEGIDGHGKVAEHARQAVLQVRHVATEASAKKTKTKCRLKRNATRAKKAPFRA